MRQLWVLTVRHGAAEALQVPFYDDLARAERCWNRHVRKGGLNPSEHPFSPVAVFQSVITGDGYVDAKRVAAF